MQGGGPLDELREKARASQGGLTRVRSSEAFRGSRATKDAQALLDQSSEPGILQGGRTFVEKVGRNVLMGCESRGGLRPKGLRGWGVGGGGQEVEDVHPGRLR